MKFCSLPPTFLCHPHRLAPHCVGLPRFLKFFESGCHCLCFCGGTILGVLLQVVHCLKQGDIYLILDLSSECLHFESRNSARNLPDLSLSYFAMGNFWLLWNFKEAYPQCTIISYVLLEEFLHYQFMTYSVLSSAPLIFSYGLVPVQALLHSYDIPIVGCLDDFLLKKV